MIYHLIYDIESICRRIVQDQLASSGLKFTLLNRDELQSDLHVSDDTIAQLNHIFSELGVQVVATPKDILVQKIKKAVRELIDMEEQLMISKTSSYLSRVLNQDYRYLSRVFSELTYTTIENYIILQRIEKAKEMIANDAFTFTEIAWKLNYSSVGHFSMQFKNTTGFTASSFKKLINQRKRAAVENGRNLQFYPIQ